MVPQALLSREGALATAEGGAQLDVAQHIGAREQADHAALWQHRQLVHIVLPV